MKKIISAVINVLCILIPALSLTACGATSSRGSSGRPAVVFILGSTANAKGLNLNSPLVQDTVYDAVYHYGYLAVVNCDGDSDVPISADLDLDEAKKNAASAMLKKRAQSECANILTAMASIVANDPEVDYLQALHLASRALNSLEGYDSKTIVVVGTGLSSTGVCSFRNNLLFAEIDAVVEKLQRSANIPDLSEVTVVWQQMGDVFAPQQELSRMQRRRLQELWGAIVEAGGGSFVYNDVFAVEPSHTAEYPQVSVVDLPAETPLVFGAAALGLEPEAEDMSAFTVPVFLPEEQVRFVPDSAEYLEPEEAKAVISPIADYLVSNPGLELLLIGSTAGDGDSDFTLTLSCRRAETVRATLISLGVAPSHLTAIGLGSSDPWHIYGAGTEGELAAQNRKVVLLDARTELAQALING